MDEVWLAANREKNDHPNRLAASGKLWGDLEDPEEVDERVKKVKIEKKENKKRKSGGDDTGNASAGKKQKKGKGLGDDNEKGKDGVETTGASSKAGESSGAKAVV